MSMGGAARDRERFSKTGQARDLWRPTPQNNPCMISYGGTFRVISNNFLITYIQYGAV